MYTTQAIADCSQSHVGFYLVIVIMTMIFAGTFWCFLKGDHDWQDLGAAVLAYVLIVPTVGYFSYTDEPPRNQKVDATFVGFTAEVESKQGVKNQTTVEHRVYGQFKVPEGTVLLQLPIGVPVPAKVVLYKN